MVNKLLNEQQLCNLDKLIEATFYQPNRTFIDCQATVDGWDCNITYGGQPTAQSCFISQSEAKKFVEDIQGFAHDNVCSSNSSPNIKIETQYSNKNTAPLFKDNWGFANSISASPRSLTFIDTDQNTSIYEGIKIESSGSSLEAYFTPANETPLTPFASDINNIAKDEYNTLRNSYLNNLQQPGKITDISINGFDDFDLVFSPDFDGTPPIVMFNVAHEDDEIGVAGTIERLIEKYGAKNVFITFTTNGDGLAGTDPLLDRYAYGRHKIEMGIQSARKFGIPDENINVFGASEYVHYNAFVNKQEREMQKTGNWTKDFQELWKNEMEKSGEQNVANIKFEYVDDPASVYYSEAQMLYRLMRKIKPKYVIAGDLLFNSQMHDFNNVITRLALNQYRKTTGEDVTFLAFPQQNKSKSYGPHVYSFNDAQIAEYGALSMVIADQVELGNAPRYHMYGGAMSIGDKIDPSTLRMRQKKDEIRDYYMSNWLDKLLFYGYAFEFGWTQVKQSMTHEFLRISNEPVSVVCPPPGEAGYDVLNEGNNNHMGIMHTCKEDWTGMRRFMAYLSDNPLTDGPIEPFDPALWEIPLIKKSEPLQTNAPLLVSISPNEDIDENELRLSELIEIAKDKTRLASDRIEAIKSTVTLVNKMNCGGNNIIDTTKAISDIIISDNASDYSKNDEYFSDSLIYRGSNLRNYLLKSAGDVLISCGQNGVDVSPYIKQILQNAVMPGRIVAAKILAKLDIKDEETVSALAISMRPTFEGNIVVSDREMGQMMQILAKVGEGNKDAFETFVWALNGGVKYTNLGGDTYAHGGYIALKSIHSYVNSNGIPNNMRNKVAEALIYGIAQEAKDGRGIDSMVSEDYVNLIIEYAGEDKMLSSARTLLGLLKKNITMTKKDADRLGELIKLIKDNFPNV